jgi:hypothetical protein
MPNEQKGYAAYIVPVPEKLPDYPPGFVPHPDHSLPGGGGTTKPTPPEGEPPSMSNPIVIPGDPQHPIAQPPGSFFPKPPPIASQLPSRPGEKGLVLVYLPGVGWSWVVVENDESAAQPKQR